MAKVNFILDTRKRKDGTSVVMLSYIHKRFRRQASLGIKVNPDNWDADNAQVSTKEKNHRHINQRLTFFRTAAEGVLLRHYGLNSDGATIYADIEAALFPEKAEEKKEEKKVVNSLVEVARRFFREAYTTAVIIGDCPVEHRFLKASCCRVVAVCSAVDGTSFIAFRISLFRP